METTQPQGLLGVLIVVATSLVALVYVFLRMAGVRVPRRGDRRAQH